MNKQIVSMALCSLFLMACGSNVSKMTVSEKSLKEVVGDKFLMGVALNVRQSSGMDTSALKIVKRHFNAIVAENCMKSVPAGPSRPAASARFWHS